MLIHLPYQAPAPLLAPRPPHVPTQTFLPPLVPLPLPALHADVSLVSLFCRGRCGSGHPAALSHLPLSQVSFNDQV